MIKVCVPGTKGRMRTITASLVEDASDLVLDNTDFDVLVDFTLPAGTMKHLDLCMQHNKPIVICTTGFDEHHLASIQESAKKIPIVLAPNTSLGVNICNMLLEKAAHLFDDRWNVNISETHHKHKLDAPSGTAKHMSQIISNSKNGEIKITSKRAGEIIGEHSVLFSTKTELVEISHTAQDRSIYAEGAITAARWLNNQPPALYSMQDVIVS